MTNKYKQALKEIKEIIRAGRSSFVSKSEIDGIFVKYEINLRELEENDNN